MPPDMQAGAGTIAGGITWAIMLPEGKTIIEKQKNALEDLGNMLKGLQAEAKVD